MIKKRQKTKLHTKFIILCYNRVSGVNHMVKILVVEDEYDIRELLQNYLENEGYQVVAASDGEQAIEVFRSSHVDLEPIRK